MTLIQLSLAKTSSVVLFLMCEKKNGKGTKHEIRHSVFSKAAVSKQLDNSGTYNFKHYVTQKQQ